jgi:hypothetical protein
VALLAAAGGGGARPIRTAASIAITVSLIVMLLAVVAVGLATTWRSH